MRFFHHLPTIVLCLIVVGAFVLVPYAFIESRDFKAACRAKDGVPVAARYSNLCLKKDALL